MIRERNVRRRKKVELLKRQGQSTHRATEATRSRTSGIAEGSNFCRPKWALGPLRLHLEKAEIDLRTLVLPVLEDSTESQDLFHRRRKRSQVIESQRLGDGLPPRPHHVLIRLSVDVPLEVRQRRVPLSRRERRRESCRRRGCTPREVRSERTESWCAAWCPRPVAWSRSPLPCTGSRRGGARRWT